MDVNFSGSTTNFVSFNVTCKEARPKRDGGCEKTSVRSEFLLPALSSFRVSLIGLLERRRRIPRVEFWSGDHKDDGKKELPSWHILMGQVLQIPRLHARSNTQHENSTLAF